MERLTCDHLEKTYEGGAKEVVVNSTVQSIVVGIQSSWEWLAVDIPVDPETFCYATWLTYG